MRGKNNRETPICLQELSVKSKASGVWFPTNLLILNSERHLQLHGGQHLHSGGRQVLPATPTSSFESPTPSVRELSSHAVLPIGGLLLY